MNVTNTQFAIGQVVRHKHHSFRGVIIDVDAEYNNTDDWWQSIPEGERPRKDQPFYHLLAENDSHAYHAYVSEQNLLTDESGEPLSHPDIKEAFGEFLGDHYELPPHYRN